MSQRVYLSLGSNIEREKHISAALTCLQNHFGSLQVSPVYESEAVGFLGDNFFNLVVAIQCKLSLSELSVLLKSIEDQYGRLRGGEKFAPRTLDIDIVLFGDLSGHFQAIELPRPELYYNAFVLKPLADLEPTLRDPKSGTNIQALWKALDSQQQLWLADWQWQSTPP